MLHFTLEMPLSSKESIYTVQLLLIFEYKLQVFFILYNIKLIPLKRHQNKIVSQIWIQSAFEQKSKLLQSKTTGHVVLKLS